MIPGVEITWGFLGCRVDRRENREQGSGCCCGWPRATEAVEVKVKEKRIQEENRRPQVLSKEQRAPCSARDHEQGNCGEGSQPERKSLRGASMGSKPIWCLLLCLAVSGAAGTGE